MKAALDRFDTNITRVRHLGHIYQAISAQTTIVVDLSDILRAELVMAVSALDHYVHEVVRLGMLKSYHSPSARTPAFSRFQVTLDSVFDGFAGPASDSWLEEQISLRHGYQSFQRPDKIAEAIRLISEVELWNEIGNRLGLSGRQAKQELCLIIQRRDKIAHEADMDPSFPGQRWPIDAALVAEAVDFIDQLVRTIHSIVA